MHDEACTHACVALLKAEGFSDDGAAELAAHPHCTPEQLRVAIDRCNRTQKKGKLRGSRQGYIVMAIVNRYTPVPTAEERRQAARPEHVQERDQADRERVARADAEHERQRQRVAALSDAELAQICAAVVAAEPDAGVREVLQNMTRRARVSPVWVPRLCAALDAAAAAPG